jgi:cytochrome c biogenesis factor
LAITAYFHSLPIVSTRTLTRELMIIVGFMSVLLAIFVTRSGLIQSVHAFAPSVVGAGVVLVLIVTLAAFFYFGRKAALPLIDFDIDWASVRSISMTIAFVTLVALTLVCLVGEAVPLFAAFVGIQISIEAGYYVDLCYPLALGFIIGLIGCDFPREISVRKYFLLVLLGVSAGSVMVLLRFPTPNALADIGLPIVLIGVATLVASFVQGLLRRSTIAGLRLVHLGATLIMVGILVSSTLVVYDTNLTVNTGQSIQVHLGMSTISIRPGNPMPETAGAVYYRGQTLPEMVGYAVEVQISNGVEAWSSELTYGTYPAYGLFYTPAIVSTPLRDYFVIALPVSILSNGTLSESAGSQSSSTTLLMSVRVVPLAGLIWLGSSAMTIGMIMRILWRSDAKKTAAPDVPNGE